MNNNKTFKILSIDGGGIKGLYSATILKAFEKEFNCQISDYFDMICGTSTGGLIALALSLKVPAQEICDFYEKEGTKIFPKSYELKILGKSIIDIGWWKQTAFYGKFTDIPLKKALTDIFGEKTIGDCKNLLCIPSYSITESKPIVFKYDHKEGRLIRDNKIKVVDIALATSAAPTFFPLAEIGDLHKEQFIDGGVWANNPTLTGLLEALDYFVGDKKPFDRLKILSLSSLSVSKGNPMGLKRERSFRHWKDELFETSLNGQSVFTNFFLQKINQISNVNIDYLRIPEPNILSSQENYIKLDEANEKSFNLMKSKGDNQAMIFIKKEELRAFFKDEKLYKI